jgi:GT2 family glycosyltransferase
MSVSAGVSAEFPGRVGVAIAAHDAADVIGRCLDALQGCPLHVVLYDDGSRDRTAAVAREHWPDVVVMRGDGTAWWAGGTQAAMQRCFDAGSDYVMMLNPDVRIDPGGVRQLVARAHDQGTITSALAVREGDEDRVVWGGARRSDFGPWLPIRVHRCLYAVGAPVASVGDDPYPTDEVHGRGVVVSREIFDRLGGLDCHTFPQYAADADFSWRALAAGVRLEIVPRVRAVVIEENSRMYVAGGESRIDRIRLAWRYLVDRRYGEALRTTPKLYFRHLPPHAAVVSTLAHLSAGVLSRLRSARPREDDGRSA